MAPIRLFAMLLITIVGFYFFIPPWYVYDGQHPLKVPGGYGYGITSVDFDPQYRYMEKKNLLQVIYLLCLHTFFSHLPHFQNTFHDCITVKQKKLVSLPYSMNDPNSCTSIWKTPSQAMNGQCIGKTYVVFRPTVGILLFQDGVKRETAIAIVLNRIDNGILQEYYNSTL